MIRSARRSLFACLLLLTSLGQLLPAIGASSVIASFRSHGISEDGREHYAERMSPDGRWLAIWVSETEDKTRLRLLDLMSGKAHDVHLPSRERKIGSIAWHPDSRLAQGVPQPSQEREINAIAWRSDSRLAAVSTASGTLLINPYRSSVEWIDKQVDRDSDFERALCCCWSPGGRVAIFRPYGDWVIWDGKTCRIMPNWESAIKAPSEACDEAWQCAWSSDEKYLAFRFYGAHGERTYSSALHTYLFDAQSGRPLKWGEGAGPVAWGDGHSFFYRTGYDVMGPYPLMVASATNAPPKSWMENSVACTVSEDRKIIYTVTDAGDVYASPTSQRKWHLIHRLNEKFSFDVNRDWWLAPMPHGLVACVGGDNGKVQRYTVTVWTDGGRVSRFKITSDIQLIGWSRARKAFVIQTYDGKLAKVSVIR